MNTKDETQEIKNPNLEAPYCSRCGEKIRGEWAIERSKIERRNICGLCRDDEINNRHYLSSLKQTFYVDKTSAKLNDSADKLMKGWGER